MGVRMKVMAVESAVAEFGGRKRMEMPRIAAKEVVSY